ncbi:ABC transporter ATP-binding protein [Agromyces bauzanensis]|uniref:ABC-type quaternary amine transporter n=1 Tax=Agromyces bauzanensis TaxID=1308924 RepID=A0A917UQC3_9MICO|nr:ABC transporter ATP-binding protein [Agromyces bauzanensis]GGJ75241.1 iron(III) ABC transporter ATP-binding protein [Agromyces bauzanensis]
MSRLEVRDLVVGYEAADVLHSVSLDVPDGALLAIVGPSGCGKTTLLRTIAGLVRARAGEIRIGQRMVTTHGIHLAPEKRRIGWVPQDAALFPHLTVAENVAFGLPSARGSARSARRAARGADVRRLLDLVGLGALGDRLPAQLSGGQAQRVALVRALASAPDVVLLDEPFGALDPILRAELRTSVRELLREEGVTGILVTHDQAEALSIADLVAVMRGGEVLQLDTPEQVYRRPATPWVAGFVGDAVFLPGTWHGDEVACTLGRLPADWVSDDQTSTSLADVPVDGAPVEVLVRPEELTLSPLADGESGRRREAGESRDEFAATVVDISYTGHDAMLTLVAGELRLRARVTAAGLLPVGSRVGVRVAGRVLAYSARA